MQQKEERERTEKEKKVKKLLNDALLTLSNPQFKTATSNSSSATTTTSKTRSNQELTSKHELRKKMLLQQILLHLEQQGVKEELLVSRSKVAELAETKVVTKVKDHIQTWINRGHQEGKLDSETAASLTLFVDSHDRLLGHNHILAECPYRFLGKLMYVPFEKTEEKEAIEE